MGDRIKSVLICRKRVGRRILKRWDINKKCDLFKIRRLLCALKNNETAFLLDTQYYLLHTVWSALCLRQKVLKKG